MFENIRIILNQTSHPGNIGAAARAMKNMGLQQLVLVDPARFPHADATARASGADDVLAGVTCCDSLQEAVAGAQLVFGLSARTRSLQWPLDTPRSCAALIAQDYRDAEIALVFGNEQSGLSNKDMALCQRIVHIPSSAEFSSLNIAAAVQVVCYELYLTAQGQHVNADADVLEQRDYASAEDKERFYQHLEVSLQHIDFLNPDKPKLLMKRLRLLYDRCQMDRSEVQMLRGMLSKMDQLERSYVE